MVRNLKSEERSKVDALIHSRPGGPPPGFEDEAAMAEANLKALRSLKRT